MLVQDYKQLRAKYKMNYFSHLVQACAVLRGRCRQVSRMVHTSHKGWGTTSERVSTYSPVNCYHLISCCLEDNSRWLTEGFKLYFSKKEKKKRQLKSLKSMWHFIIVSLFSTVNISSLNDDFINEFPKAFASALEKYRIYFWHNLNDNSFFFALAVKAGAVKCFSQLTDYD